ncbi:MAG: hypothetical protein KDK45_19760 [Leptospiraceae bacterium]|nr:hypothetical protein [Leptospiraceae bacterium]
MKRFSVLSNLSAAFAKLTSVSFDRRKYTSYHTYFLKENYSALDISNDKAFVDFRKLTFSRGNLPVISGSKIKKNSKQLEISWIYNGYGKAEDDIIFFLYNPLQQLTHVEKAKRDSQALSFSIPNSWKTQAFYIYYFCKSPSTNQQSDSVYLGERTII